MRAIFYADWINLRGSLRVMLLTPAAFLAWALVIGKPLFFCVSLVVMGYLFPNTAFSVEESTGWNRLSLSLPVTRADVVNSRFVMAVLIHAVLAAVGAAFVLVHAVLTDGTPELTDHLAELLACAAVAMLLNGVQMAAAFRWGIRKAAYLVMGLIWVPMLACTLLYIGCERLGISLQPLLTALKAWNVTGGLLRAMIALGIAVLTYVLCWRISVQVYQKKEL